MTLGNALMIVIGSVFITLAIRKDYEPLLLVPIGFGVIVGNIPPIEGMMLSVYDKGSVLNMIYFGVSQGLLPPLIFLGIGAMTDFSTTWKKSNIENILQDTLFSAPGKGGMKDSVERWSDAASTAQLAQIYNPILSEVEEQIKNLDLGSSAGDMASVLTMIYPERIKEGKLDTTAPSGMDLLKWASVPAACCARSERRDEQPPAAGCRRRSPAVSSPGSA